MRFMLGFEEIEATDDGGLCLTPSVRFPIRNRSPPPFISIEVLRRSSASSHDRLNVKRIVKGIGRRPTMHMQAKYMPKCWAKYASKSFMITHIRPIKR